MLTTRFIFFVFVILLFSCQNQKTEKSHSLIVMQYFTELNSGNIEKASAMVDNDILLLESDIKQASGIEDWFRQFKWDSVFSPTYGIIETIDSSGNVNLTVSKICKRINFLHDEPIIYKELIDFKDDKIGTIKTYEYVVFNLDKWQGRRDSLVEWVDINHPELSGFIYDQTIKGGQNYLKAIELYENR